MTTIAQLPKRPRYLYLASFRSRLYDGSVDGDSHAIDAQLSAAASAVNARVFEVSEDIRQQLIRRIPALHGDDVVVNLLASSVEGNVATMLHILEHGILPESPEAPAAALEYTRRLAQRGVPLDALVRAYRVGHGRFLEFVMAEVALRVRDATEVVTVISRLHDLSFRYIDRVSERVISIYQEERDRWLLTKTAARAGRVRMLLDGTEADVDSAEAALGYRLRQHHLGLVSWIPEPTRGGEGLARLDRVTVALGEALSCRGRPLFVPCDESVAWSWLPLGSRLDVAWEVLGKTVDEHDPTAVIAAGEPAPGMEGFRQTHRQALRAQDVANVARTGARVTTFAHVGPVALLLADLEATRGWVWQVLGPLATDDAHNAGLRETLLVFLSTGSSYTASAEILTVHKTPSNTECANPRKPSAIPFRTAVPISSSRCGLVITWDRRSFAHPRPEWII